ncbi:hypothetical protein K443DRAFT_656506 [Laccaria amethystina LaAM-08-1]|uniref:Uncharacterized protein n=1 Tax=Laccaria amethystina LaAM-08-1 TaxID=1095629 RepID=A0A0C9Y3X8_9AGAR|nr:hypothetical protein K443DRAFT_656506 [Laccaria amethystina LaAM-08-1]
MSTLQRPKANLSESLIGTEHSPKICLLESISVPHLISSHPTPSPSHLPLHSPNLRISLTQNIRTEGEVPSSITIPPAMAQKVPLP